MTCYTDQPLAAVQLDLGFVSGLAHLYLLCHNCSTSNSLLRLSNILAMGATHQTACVTQLLLQVLHLFTSLQWTQYTRLPLPFPSS